MLYLFRKCCKIRVLQSLEIQYFVGTSMFYERKRRKPDLFSVLLILVTLGMSVTLAYQINVYYGVDRIPIAKQTQTAGSVGG